MNQREHTSLDRVRYDYGEKELRLLGYPPNMPSALSTSTAKSTMALNPQEIPTAATFLYSCCIFLLNWEKTALFTSIWLLHYRSSSAIANVKLDY